MVNHRTPWAMAFIANCLLRAGPSPATLSLAGSSCKDCAGWHTLPLCVSVCLCVSLCVSVSLSLCVSVSLSLSVSLCLSLSLSLCLCVSLSLCFFLFRAERCSSKLSVRNSSSVDQWWSNSWEWEVLKSWDTKHHKRMYTHIIFHGGTHGIHGTISSDAKSSSGNPKFTPYGSQKSHLDLFSRGSVEQVESIWFWSFLIFQS